MVLQRSEQFFHALRTFMPTNNLELGRPTLATLESTAFLALGFGAVNDFRTPRDPLGRFTLFLWENRYNKTSLQDHATCLY